MKHNLTKLFTLLILAAMSMGAMASTVDDLVAIDCDYVFIADDITSNGTVGLTANTLYANGHIFSQAGNSVATNKGNSIIQGISHVNSLRLKNAQDRLAFKVSGACTVTFYGQAWSWVDDKNTRGIIVSNIDNNTDKTAASVIRYQPQSVDKFDVNIPSAGTYYLTSFGGDIFFAGFEVVFPDDPAAVEFGFTRTVAAETSTSSDGQVADKYRISDDIAIDPSIEGVTFSKNFGEQNIMTDKSRPTYWYNGTETKECYVDKLDKNYRNYIYSSAEMITSLDERCYYGFDLTIAEGYKMSLVRIISDVFKDANNTHYQIKVYNNGTLIKTLEDVSVSNYTTSDMKRSVRVACEEGLQNLTGEVSVKMYFWNTGTIKYMVLKDLKVKALVHSITGQTKTLKAVEINGVDYDFENEGSTIDALYHAAPSVKFYYDVKNNWSDGSQTAAPDEDETIVASESAGNYVATTTKLATPYSLTFTNIDLPKTFGITRAVDNETSEAPDETQKYHLGNDAVVDPSVTGVAVTKNYGGQNAMNGPRYINWYDGTETRACYVNNGEVSYRTYLYSSSSYVSELNENCYYGFDIAISLGYKVSIQSLVSDVLRDNNTGVNSLRYQVKIYQEGICIKTLDEVAVTNLSNKREIDLSEDAALQDLSGNISVKMFFWAQGETTGARYINVKDLNISAVVEEKAGEGVTGLVFTDFTPAPQPVFAEGEVTAVWSNSVNNVGPATENRGIRMQGTYEYKMKVEVPSDSYISEVVIVWNGKGNYYSGDEDPKRIIDLHILNSSEVEVDALEYRGTKVNETTWSCGNLRESELTFVQGIGGDIYVNSIRVTYLRKEYTRTHKHMNLNTLCYPYQIDYYEGATFYTMLRKEVDGVGNPTDVYLQEHVGALEAGKPYFYVPEGSELVCYYSGAYTAAEKVNGVQGCYADNTAVPVNSYVTYNNIIQNIGSNSQVTLGEYRAYIVMDEVAGDAVAAPGRRILRVGNGHNSATGIETVEERALMRDQKVIRDGQLFIIRDGKMYNAQGQRVK